MSTNVCEVIKMVELFRSPDVASTSGSGTKRLGSQTKIRNVGFGHLLSQTLTRVLEPGNMEFGNLDSQTRNVGFGYWKHKLEV